MRLVRLHPTVQVLVIPLRLALMAASNVHGILLECFAIAVMNFPQPTVLPIVKMLEQPLALEMEQLIMPAAEPANVEQDRVAARELAFVTALINIIVLERGMLAGQARAATASLRAVTALRATHGVVACVRKRQLHLVIVVMMEVYLVVNIVQAHIVIV